MKKRTPEQYAEILWGITKGLSGAQLKEALGVFLSLLYKERALSKVDHLIAAFEKKVKRQEGIVDIEVTTARTIGVSIKKTIEQTFGSSVNMTTKIDEAVLGGIIIRTEDAIMDASIRNRLQRLQQQLVH